MGWNPNDYEMVEVRIRKFLDLHDDGRIITDLIPDENEWIFRTSIYLTTADQDGGWAKATGYATEKKGSVLLRRRFQKRRRLGVVWRTWVCMVISVLLVSRCGRFLILVGIVSPKLTT